MNPYLKAGDKVYVLPCPSKAIRKGDVVVFRRPDTGQRVTHRIIRIGSTGLRTRGDHNSECDPWMVYPDHLIGRLVWVQRGKRFCKVRGGWVGFCRGQMLHGYAFAKLQMKSAFRPIYRSLCKCGFFKSSLNPCLRTVSYAKSEGTEIHLFWRSWWIGRRPAGTDQWCIRFPFKLFIDNGHLPGC